MNTNDLPPAAKLAALIEAGVAANPGIQQGRSAIWKNGKACAIGFALLGSGMTGKDLSAACNSARVMQSISERLGLQTSPCTASLYWSVALMNDDGAPIEKICTALRDGQLAAIPA